MRTQLSVGEAVTLEASRQPWRVAGSFGIGGQGAVYRVMSERGSADRPLALKWYHPHVATPEQRMALRSLVRRGPPDSRFLWPLDLTDRRQGSFGYVMPVRPARFTTMNDVMTRKAELDMRSTATAAYQLADAFLALHALGYCYRDISLSNVFLDPYNGDVLICDNDNVAIDGTPIAVVSGTVGFMAPEVMRGEAPPSTATDLYSLSVLLFHLLFVHHPLLGRRELQEVSLDNAAKRHLFGENPVFIFDPADNSNEPVPGYHDNAIVLWPLYPAFIRRLFERAFGGGLWNPVSGRVRETEWRQAALRLRDACISCTTCGKQCFWDDASGSVPDCWNCGVRIAVPLRIEIDDPGSTVVALGRGSVLFPHHIAGRRYDFSRAVAEVTRNPSRPDVWGLTNRSPATWIATGRNGIGVPVPPGRTVRLAAGTHIDFGEVRGTIAR